MSLDAMKYMLDECEASGTDLWVLMCLADYSNDDGFCYPGMKRLRKRSRLKTMGGLYKCMERLMKNGHLAIEKGKRRSHQYYLCKFRESRGMTTIPEGVDAIQTVDEWRIWKRKRNYQSSTGVELSDMPQSSTGVELYDETQSSTGVELDSSTGVELQSSTGVETNPSFNHQENHQLKDSAPEKSARLSKSYVDAVHAMMDALHKHTKDQTFKDLTTAIDDLYGWGNPSKGQKAARTMKLFHMLRGTSKKNDAYDLTPPVNAIEFRLWHQETQKGNEFAIQNETKFQANINQWRAKRARRAAHIREFEQAKAADEARKRAETPPLPPDDGRTIDEIIEQELGHLFFEVEHA